MLSRCQEIGINNFNVMTGIFDVRGQGLDSGLEMGATISKNTLREKIQGDNKSMTRIVKFSNFGEETEGRSAGLEIRKRPWEGPVV